MGWAVSPMRTNLPLCQDGIGALKRSGHCLTSATLLDFMLALLKREGEVTHVKTARIDGWKVEYRSRRALLSTDVRQSVNISRVHIRFTKSISLAFTISIYSIVEDGYEVMLFLATECQNRNADQDERAYFRHGYDTNRFPSSTKNFMHPFSPSVNQAVSGSESRSLAEIRKRYAKL